MCIQSCSASPATDSMPLLRLSSYCLGVNASDKKKGTQLPALLSRLHHDNVDIVCLQEVRPHVKQSYSRHPMVEKALDDASYTFGSAGNCTTGGADLMSSVSCRQFPDDDLGKYSWRALSKTFFRHRGLFVTVINSHTRAGEGPNDTSDTHRVQVLTTCKKEVIQEQTISDLVFVVGDFNMIRPWNKAVKPKFEAAMDIPGIQALFEHSAPDHIVCYVTNPNLKVHSFLPSPIMPIGKSHDGVGDHEGLLKDLNYSVVVAPEIVHTQIAAASPPMAKVIEPWNSIGDGYLTLQKAAHVVVVYRGAESSGDEGWSYVIMYGDSAAGWFPSHCIQYGTFAKVMENWKTEISGYLPLVKDDILEVVYTGTTCEESGWIYASHHGNDYSGWCPAHCVKML